MYSKKIAFSFFTLPPLSKHIISRNVITCKYSHDAQWPLLSTKKVARKATRN